MRKTKGFTLIELVIYISIIGGILIVFLNFTWEVIYGEVKAQSIREVQQNMRFAMEKIVRITKKSLSVNSPSPGETDSVLSLEMTEPALNPTVIEISNDKITITEGGSGPYELTNSRVKVDSLSFTNLSYPGSPGTVLVETAISHVNPSNQKHYEASFSFNSTVSLLEGGVFPGPPGYCQGTPSSCDNFFDQTSCQNQIGCTWSPDYCQGVCTPCSFLWFWCFWQDGCFWDWEDWQCEGTCTACENYGDQWSCYWQQGCSWGGSYCSGSAASCDGFSTEVTCESQQGCSWIIP